MEATSWSSNSQVFRWIFSHSIHNHTDTSKLVTFTFWSVSAVVSLIHGLRKHRVQHCHHYHRTHFQSRQTGRTGIGSTPLTQPCLRFWGPRPGRTVQWINWQDHGTKQNKPIPVKECPGPHWRPAHQKLEGLLEFHYGARTYIVEGILQASILLEEV